MSSEPNIIGVNFTPDLTDQINIRQGKLGKFTLDPEDIIYNNSKTSWLRVSSGVEIKEWEKTGLGDYNRFDSKDFVLMGGVIGKEGPSSALQPLATTTSDVTQDQIISQYGIGDYTKWGWGPPPSVISADVKSLNRGAVRKTTLMLTAHNPDQFKMLELLYLRLGFSILVEWGHTHYYNSDGDLQQSDFLTTPYNTFFDNSNKGYQGFFDLGQEIKEERKKYNYNYDAFVGFVSQFSWSIGNTGTYNITLDVISAGALVESLTATRSTTNSDAGESPGGDKNTVGNKIESYLSYWREVLKEASEENTTLEGVGKDSPTPLPDSVTQGSEDLEKLSKLQYTKNLTTDDSKELFKFEFEKEGEIIRYPFNNPGGSNQSSEGESAYYYISFGALLKLLEKSIYRDTQDVPAIKIDYGYNKSYMHSHPYQQSLSPDKCILSSIMYKEEEVTSRDLSEEEINQRLNDEISSAVYTGNVQDNTTYDPSLDAAIEEIETNAIINNTPPTSPPNENPEPSTPSTTEEIPLFEPSDYPNYKTYAISNVTFPINTKEVPYFKNGTDGNIERYEGYQGDIMGVMINFDLITSNLQSLQRVNSEGTVPILDFLKSILDNIAQSTGNINDFNVSFNEDERKIVIYDETIAPGIKTPQTGSKEGSFHIQGFKNNLEVGSFITNFSFQSKVFPQINSLVAISAQSGGAALPGKGSSFQALNRNLRDRLMGDTGVKVEGNNVNNNSTTDNYAHIIFSLNSFFKDIYVTRNYSPNNLPDHSTSLRDILNYDLQLRILDKEIPSPFYIPVSLTLDMDGLSGMTLYEKFGITPDYILPSDYPDNLNFIITGINHSIKDGKWITKLETLCFPKALPLSDEPTETSSDGSTEILRGANASTTEENNTPEGNSEWEILNSSEPLFIQEEIKEKKGEDIETRYENRSIDEALALLHPYARNKFRSFFEKATKLRKLNGYRMVITSSWRSIVKQKRIIEEGNTLATNKISLHTFGTAIDINLAKATGAFVANSRAENSKWIDSGIVNIANGVGIFWGGLFEDPKRDPVHFYIDINRTESKKSIEEANSNRSIDIIALRENIFKADLVPLKASIDSSEEVT